MPYQFTQKIENDLIKQSGTVNNNNCGVLLTYATNTITYLTLLTIHTYTQGEEVMNTYGPLCNAGLVRMYGFAESDNPNDKVHSVCIVARILHVVVGLYSSKLSEGIVSGRSCAK